jgi:hypothetical protein
MLKLRACIIALIFATFIGVALYRAPTGVTNARTKPRNARSSTEENRFLGRWSSHITYTSGERVNDGFLDITDVSPASANRVRVLHSFRGGPFTAYIMPEPDRIEIQMALGNGRVAHYNGIIVSPDRVEGHYFATEDQQLHHSRKRLVSNRVLGRLDEDEGTWILTKP